MKRPRRDGAPFSTVPRPANVHAHMAARAAPIPESSSPVIGRGTHPVRVLGLLAVGLALWAWVEYRAAANHGHGLGPVRWILVVAAAAGAALVPGVQKVVLKLLDRIRQPTPRATEWATFGITLAATCYFVAT